MAKPTNREFREIFDAAASSYDAVGNPYTRARRIEFVLASAKGRCLEIGAGTGEIARALSAGHDVTATDISPKMVEEIRRKGLSAIVCDAEQLPFPDSTFDTVVAAEVIYYLDYPDRFLAEAHRVLYPGGRLLITSATRITRVYDALRGVLRALGIKGTYFDDKMHRFPSVRSLRALIRGAGFFIESERRMIVLPLRALDALNRILERTPLKHLAAFVVFSAVRS